MLWILLGCVLSIGVLNHPRICCMHVGSTMTENVIYVIPDESCRVKNQEMSPVIIIGGQTNPLHIDKKVKKVDMIRQKSYKGPY